jgi:hypothetical protein
MVTPTCFGIIFPSSGSDRRDFLEMYSIEHISKNALGPLPEDGNMMPKHVGDTTNWIIDAFVGFHIYMYWKRVYVPSFLKYVGPFVHKDS